MDDFLLYALLGGIGVAVLAGPMGCFVVWRRMSYFGAALAHTALLGIALGLLFDVGANTGILLVCLGTALALAALQRIRPLPTDTLLGILAHGALALGLLAVSFLDTVRVDLMGYLFGDILAVSPADLMWILIGGAIALAVLVKLWKPLLAITVHEELAHVEGVRVEAVRLAFMLLIALVIAIGMKIVGVLLIVSLLIIPAAIARRFARTPEIMALGAMAAGVASVLGGLQASLTWDLPTGPAIVSVAFALFMASFLIRRDA